MLTTPNKSNGTQRSNKPETHRMGGGEGSIYSQRVSTEGTSEGGKKKKSYHTHTHTHTRQVVVAAQTLLQC